MDFEFTGYGGGASYSSGSGFDEGTGFGDGSGLGDADRFNPRTCCFAYGYGVMTTIYGDGSGEGTTEGMSFEYRI